MIAKLFLATSLLVTTGTLEGAIARPKVFNQSQVGPAIYAQWGDNKSEATASVPIERPRSEAFSHQYGPRNSWISR
jgi:hypothetical protein